MDILISGAVALQRADAWTFPSMPLAALAGGGGITIAERRSHSGGDGHIFVVVTAAYSAAATGVALCSRVACGFGGSRVLRLSTAAGGTPTFGMGQRRAATLRARQNGKRVCTFIEHHRRAPACRTGGRQHSLLLLLLLAVSNAHFKHGMFRVEGRAVVGLGVNGAAGGVKRWRASPVTPCCTVTGFDCCRRSSRFVRCRGCCVDSGSSVRRMKRRLWDIPGRHLRRGGSCIPDLVRPTFVPLPPRQTCMFPQ